MPPSSSDVSDADAGCSVLLPVLNSRYKSGSVQLTKGVLRIYYLSFIQSLGTVQKDRCAQQYHFLVLENVSFLELKPKRPTLARINLPYFCFLQYLWYVCAKKIIERDTIRPIAAWREIAPAFYLEETLYHLFQRNHSYSVDNLSH